MYKVGRIEGISLANKRLLYIGELGDYDSNKHGAGYLNDFRFVPFQNVGFENEVQQYHKQHR